MQSADSGADAAARRSRRRSSAVAPPRRSARSAPRMRRRRSARWRRSIGSQRRGGGDAADDEAWPAAPEAEAFKLGVFALVRLSAYDALAAAVLDRAGGRSRPGGRSRSRCSASTTRGRRRRCASSRRCRGATRPPSRCAGWRRQGRAGRAARARGLDPAKTPREVRRRGDPRRGALGRAAGSGAARGDRRRRQAGAEPAAGGGHRARRAEGGRPPCRSSRTSSPTTGRRCAPRRCAPPPRSIRRASRLVLSGLDVDRHWMVRAALAEVLGTLPPRSRSDACDRCCRMRTSASSRRCCARSSACACPTRDDRAHRAPARVGRRSIRERGSLARRDEGGGRGRGAARGLQDGTGGRRLRRARGSARGARGVYGRRGHRSGARGARRTRTGRSGCGRWSCWRSSSPAVDHRMAIRPAPGAPPAPYDDPQLVARDFSPHVFIETARGTIEFELAVLDAPQTARNFMALARKGFFNGLQVHRVVPNFVVQDGDPRGDGEGGPGYTIRDELNERPYLRGTVGMALVVARHRRQPVLHHALAAAAPRRPLHGVRARRQRHGRRRSDPGGRCDPADARVGREVLALSAYSKKGATAAPFYPTTRDSAGGPRMFGAGKAAYRFLPPFFFPPLAVFFAIALIPPFARGFLRGLSPRCSAAAVLARRPALSAPVASLG